MDAIKSIFDLWGMPLIFVISGASIFFALRPGGAARFLRERVRRLLVPLALGILVLAPPQIYLERLTHGEFQGTFFEFLPLYFRDWSTSGGNFAWSGVHLWYLEDLFLFTLVLLPLFRRPQAPGRPAHRGRLSARLSVRPGMILLWLVPYALWLIPFDPLGFVGPGLTEDLTRLLVFPPFVVYGYLVFSDLRIQQAIVQQRRFLLVLALLCTLAAPAVAGLASERAGVPTLVLVMLLLGLLIWSTVLTIVGYGMRYLTVNHRLLGYANEAVLPIYVLHQPVILLVGFFVIPLALPILAKYLIIAATAFGLTLGLYAFGVRRWNPVRQIFGLKPRRPDLPLAAAADLTVRAEPADDDDPTSAVLQGVRCMNAQLSTLGRRYDLDRLRVLAILGVFVYHCTLIFAPDPYSIKNATLYEFLDDWGGFGGTWGLPLVFIISGASAFYALDRVRPAKFLQGVVLRLVVPLLVGMLTHSALQVYLERLQAGAFRGSFFEFYPHYFEGLYGFGGNFAWMGMHLWYLELLFLFILLCLPLFVWLKNTVDGQRALQGLGDFLAKPGAIYLLALPAYILINVLDPDSWGTDVLGDWSIFIYLSFFVSGFVIFSHDGLQATIRRWRWISLAAGIVLWWLIDPLWMALGACRRSAAGPSPWGSVRGA